MIKRIILAVLCFIALAISGCNSKLNTVEVTPTIETTEEIITIENIGE